MKRSGLFFLQVLAAIFLSATAAQSGESPVISENRNGLSDSKNVLDLHSAKNNSVDILGYDLDKNGVRDDVDSLINVRFPSDFRKRAAYRYVAKMIQSEWAAFYQDPQMSYEKLLPYSVYIDLGLDFIDESGAENELKYSVFIRRIINTTERISFSHKIDEVFAGKILPVAVRHDKRYSQFVERGLADYQRVLQAEKEMKKFFLH